jgi:hypothetical protein
MTGPSKPLDYNCGHEVGLHNQEFDHELHVFLRLDLRVGSEEERGHALGVIKFCHRDGAEMIRVLTSQCLTAIKHFFWSYFSSAPRSMINLDSKELVTVCFHSLKRKDFFFHR